MEWGADPSKAIKAPVNIFLTQFPVINYGCAKSGAPISYVRTEGLSVEGMECLTDLENLPNYAWHSSYHSFQKEVAKAQVKNPDLVRCVYFCSRASFHLGTGIDVTFLQIKCYVFH